MADSVEEWRSIEGFEGLYDVSNFGRVRSLKRGRVIILNLESTGSGGIPNFGAYKQGKRYKFTVHRCVAAAFLGPRPDNLQICHNDGNPKNNHVSNLRYDTAKNNQFDRHAHGTRCIGSKNPLVKLKEEDISKIFDLRNSGKSYVDIATVFKVSDSTVQSVCSGTTWKELGFSPCSKRKVAKIDQDMRSKIIEKINLGVKQQQIASEFGIDQTTVSKIKRKMENDE